MTHEKCRIGPRTHIALVSLFVLTFPPPPRPPPPPILYCVHFFSPNSHHACRALNSSASPFPHGEYGNARSTTVPFTGVTVGTKNHFRFFLLTPHLQKNVFSITRSDHGLIPRTVVEFPQPLTVSSIPFFLFSSFFLLTFPQAGILFLNFFSRAFALVWRADPMYRLLPFLSPSESLFSLSPRREFAFDGSLLRALVRGGTL